MTHRLDGAVLVQTGDGSVWIRHVRRLDDATGSAVKLPATSALADRLIDVPEWSEPSAPDRSASFDIGYERVGDVGLLNFDFYNGAMSTAQCHRLLFALRRVVSESTRVLVVGGGECFSNGIHLNVVEAAPDPAAEAWRNINAIDDVCREIITCTSQIVVSSVQGSAGAGGVMMALGADRVIVRGGVVLNPHYRTMGLYGSEYWTYVLPGRVGDDMARRLTERCLPIGSDDAVAIGLADEVVHGSRREFDLAVLEYARRLAAGRYGTAVLAAKRVARAADETRRPLETYRVEELAEMSRDIFDDRHGFAQARRNFVMKGRPSSTPRHLLDIESRIVPACRAPPDRQPRSGNAEREAAAPFRGAAAPSQTGYWSAQ